MWFSLTFPVCSKFPDFSLTGKCLPIFPGFPGFPVRVGTLFIPVYDGFVGFTWVGHPPTSLLPAEQADPFPILNSGRRPKLFLRPESLFELNHRDTVTGHYLDGFGNPDSVCCFYCFKTWEFSFKHCFRLWVVHEKKMTQISKTKWQGDCIHEIYYSFLTQFLLMLAWCAKDSLLRSPVLDFVAVQRDHLSHNFSVLIYTSNAHPIFAVNFDEYLTVVRVVPRSTADAPPASRTKGYQLTRSQFSLQQLFHCFCTLTHVTYALGGKKRK